MTRILSVEDDEVILQEIQEALCACGHEVDTATTGRSGLAKVMSESYDAVTLDRTLPDIDGLMIIAAMRGVGIRTPVLILSAVSALDERVRGLRAGGDDYLTKPFSPEEMSARIEVLLRHRTRASAAKTVFNLGSLRLDLVAHNVQFHGQNVELLPTEFRILEYMMRNPGQLLTRTMIFEEVWGYRFDPGTNVIDVHVSRLRNRLAAIADSPAVKTRRGSGYMLAE
ncbi:response regulator transcription factor [Paraburkholderia bannensis]|uniref:response regulator transcription factor n=1 Tax=Paraburkholderia bannensis TaxID=765414 RepID=UPI00047F326A|nr:response regulator transcription factor [Paraburkholderia bannensis]